MMSGEKGDEIDFSDEEGEEKVVQLNLDNNQDDKAQKNNQTMNMPVSVHMLDISWIFEETSDGMEHTYGDLMGILETAPRKFIDTQFVRTFIQNLWDDYFWAILKYKLLPQLCYLISTVLYFSFLLFNDGFKTGADHRSPEGLKPGERMNFNIEFVCRMIIVIFLLYHLMYECMQMWRFKAWYFSDTGNWVDLISISLNGFIITYHVYDFQFFKHYIILVAAIAMSIMWI